jgi:hypothetical protein
VTQQGTNDDERLIGYLLGQVDPEEQARIEERYFGDPGFHDELAAAERDLIDRYVRGELKDPQPFEERYLSSPRRRQRVEFARALMRSLDASAARTQPDLVDRVSRAPVLQMVRPRRLSVRSWLPVAAAAAAVLLAAWVFVNWPPPDGSDQNAPEAPRQATGEPPAQTVPAPDARPAPPSPGARSTPIATLMLAPSLTREGGVTPTLVIGRDAVPQLQLALEPGDYRTYRGVLRTADGAEVWRIDGLRPVSTADGQALVVSLPLGLLRDDDYTITISGVAADGEVEPAAGYYFRAHLR